MAKSKNSKSTEPEPQNPNPAASESPSASPETTTSNPKNPEQASEEQALIPPSRRPPHPTNAPPQQPPKEKESFESYYLRQITQEFADDIDKIRNAPDFTEKSVPVLVQALKQSGANFTEEEKRTIVGGKV